MSKGNNQIKLCVSTPELRDLIQEKISQIQAAGGQNKLFNKTSVLEYLLVKSIISVLECEEEFLEVRGDLKDFEIIDLAIETIKKQQGEK